MPGEDFSLWPGYNPWEHPFKFKLEHGYIASLHPHIFANDWREHTGRPPMSADEINKGNFEQGMNTAGKAVGDLAGTILGGVAEALKGGLETLLPMDKIKRGLKIAGITAAVLGVTGGGLWLAVKLRK